jgi:hypothetical protein
VEREVFTTPGLGDNTYFVVPSDEAALIDPQRDSSCSPRRHEAQRSATWLRRTCTTTTPCDSQVATSTCERNARLLEPREAIGSARAAFDARFNVAEYLDRPLWGPKRPIPASMDTHGR